MRSDLGSSAADVVVELPALQVAGGEAARRAASAEQGATIAERLDRLPVTALHFAILGISAVGLFADIAELVLSNVFSAVLLAAPYNVARGDLSLLLASVFAGGAIGAPALGWFADRYGRRVALQMALAILTASSLAAAASRDVSVMTGFRFISGLALGAYPPLTAAYLSDVLPPRRRGMLMLLCAALACLGAPAVIFLIRWLTPLAPLRLEGWRWALILGGLLSAAAAVSYWLLPESPRWLASLGYGAKADLACRRFEAAAGVSSMPSGGAQPAPVRETIGFRKLLLDRGSLRRAALLGALNLFGPWATIGFPLLSTAVMMQKGFRISDSLLFAGLTMFGPALGNGVVALVIDRIERRLALALCTGVMMAAAIAFAISVELMTLIIIGTVFNLTIAVYSTILGLYGAELFPTNLRASATSGAWGISRVVSALVPIVLLPLLGSLGASSMIAVITTALLASLALILVAAPPGLARRPVE